MKKVAYLVSKLTFWGFVLFSAIVIPLSILSFFEYYFNWDIPFIEIFSEDGQDYSKIKNIGVQFLLSYTVILMWGTFIYYSVYFYVLQGFFKIFIAEKTFQKASLRQLTKFYKLNFIPVLVGVIGIIIRYILLGKFKFDEPHFFVLIHLIIAFFLYFYLDLIKKGHNIQIENDLTI